MGSSSWTHFWLLRGLRRQRDSEQQRSWCLAAPYNLRLDTYLLCAPSLFPHL